MSGIKHDQGKLPMELLPPELFTRIARVLQFGAEKYAPRNWEKGMDWGRLYAAAMRHLTAWWGGEDTDPETGFSHLDHAACCIMFLFTYEERGLGEDDRPQHWKRTEIIAESTSGWRLVRAPYGYSLYDPNGHDRGGWSLDDRDRALAALGRAIIDGV